MMTSPLMSKSRDHSSCPHFAATATRGVNAHGMDLDTNHLLHPEYHQLLLHEAASVASSTDRLGLVCKLKMRCMSRSVVRRSLPEVLQRAGSAKSDISVTNQFKEMLLSHNVDDEARRSTPNGSSQNVLQNIKDMSGSFRSRLSQAAKAARLLAANSTKAPVVTNFTITNSKVKCSTHSNQVALHYLYPIPLPLPFPLSPLLVDRLPPIVHTTSKPLPIHRLAVEAFTHAHTHTHTHTHTQTHMQAHAKSSRVTSNGAPAHA